MSEKIAELREWLLIQNVQAFLRVIRAGETNQDDSAFRMMFGGEMFQSFKDHPRKVITKKLGGKEYSSSAAGAYQFLSKTWDGLVAQYKFPDFSPEYQHLGAVALIKGRKALEDVIAGRFDAAILKCGKEWASLPGSPYGQPTKTLAQAKAVYEKYGGTYAGSSNPIAIPQVKPMAAPILLSLLPALVDLIPKLGSIFGSGSEVANRNIAAATVVADAVKSATNSPNLQAAIEAIQNDPEALAAANAAVDSVWLSITEVGTGGIKGARDANLAMQNSEKPFWFNPAFWLTLLLLGFPAALCVDVFYIHPDSYDANSRTQVITALLAVLTVVAGYWLGSSAGSAKKDSLIGSK